MNKEIEIPEGYEARIEGNKVILELKESEDERIRKEIIWYLTHRADVTVFVDETKDCERWIAYLERQKEQKDYRKLYEDIAKSEWFKKAYEGKSLGCDEEQKEQQPAEWSEEEAKKAAENYANEFPGMTHENDGSTIEDYDKPYNDFMAGVLWAKHQYQPKQEWSEEDEELLDAMMDMVANSLYEPLCPRANMFVWLKSLPERISHPIKSDNWKPSEEQIVALARATNRCVGVDDAKILIKLLEQLEKL